jgi:hypothetical protein
MITATGGRLVRLVTVWRGEPLELEVELPAHAIVSARVRGRSIQIEIDLAELVHQLGVRAIRAGGRVEDLGGLVSATVVG